MLDLKVSRFVFFNCLLFLYFGLFAQNTVGVISYDQDQITDGYTLLYPMRQSNVYLINNCGEVVHEWTDSNDFGPGISVYLQEDGTLLKTKRPNAPIQGSFSNGGSGAIIELRSWDNELIWSTEVADSTFRAHHDVEMLPNGNVLIIAWQRRSKEEFIQAGGDTTLFNELGIWPDIVREYDPVLDSVVWLWNSWNHIIQDMDNEKDNFGDVASNPGKIDLNYDLSGYVGRPDWIHSNAIDYNEELDQILLCSPHFEEIWIIDHSTTTEEAKGNVGGQSGKGGQLLFRWGNPRAYKMGDIDDKKLFFQHDAHWIDDPLLQNSEYYQQIGLFNNRVEPNQSSIDILNPEFNGESKEYEMNSGTFLPSFFNERIESSIDLPFNSTNMSSMQVLPNGNFLACGAQNGRIIEFNSQGEVVWDYVLPYRNGFRINQGSNLNTGDNVIFRAKRYDINFDAFNGKNLQPKYYLELEPDLEFCDLSLNTLELESSEFKIFPLPVSNLLTIKSDKTHINEISIFNSVGEKIMEDQNVNSLNYSTSTSDFNAGIYIIILNNSFIYKVLKIN